MKPFKRGKYYQLDLRWRGIPRIRVSTRTVSKARAEALLNTLVSLKNAGRIDLLSLLADGRIDLLELHDAYLKRGDELDQLKVRAESSLLGPLVDEWLAWLPTGISQRSKRRYSPRTITRYEVSWAGLFATLSKGRNSTLSDLTTGFVADYRASRRKANGGKDRYETQELPGAGTLNRDMNALGSFLTWCQTVKGIHLVRPKIIREREPTGRMRWLNAEELKAFEANCPDMLWPFFACLFYTGARVGEVQGLLGGDITLVDRRIQIHDGETRKKTATSSRILPISEPLVEALGEHLARTKPNASSLVFTGDLQNTHKVERVWRNVCKAARIEGATPHDARHTFGVHAAIAGVPVVRLQELLGHASLTMTMRYMRHAPTAYLDVDAASISESMTHDREEDARRRAALKTA